MSSETIFRKGPASTSKMTPLMAEITKGLLTRYKTRRNRFFAKDSAVCYRRSNFFVLAPEEWSEKFDAAGELYTAIGNAMHDAITKGFQNSGVLLAAEIRMPDVSMNLGGRIDAIVQLENQEPRVVEIKTVGALPASPRSDHRTQALVYSLITGLDNPILLYQSRSVASFGGDLTMREFELTSSEAELTEVAIDLSISYFSALAKKLPPKPLKFGSKSACGFCPFTKYCWDGEPIPDSIPLMADEDFLEVSALALQHAKLLMEERPARREEFLKQFIKEDSEEKDGTAE